MEFVQFLVSFILHIDQHLQVLMNDYGTWVYLILFLIVFCETGLVVTPFLPGDSLLFAAGALTVGTALDVNVLALVIFVAAVLGNTVNYSVGHFFGDRLFTNNESRWLRKDYLDRTHAFYEKHGGKTIIITRFMPIVRTFAPFVAGMGSMSYKRFTLYNVVGGLLWTVSFVYAGHQFGAQEIVRKNFTLMIFGIIGISLLPMVFEILRHKLARKVA